MYFYYRIMKNVRLYINLFDIAHNKRMTVILARLEKRLIRHITTFFDIVLIMANMKIQSNIQLNTPSKTQAEYIRRINLALKFIEQNLDQTIQLDDVARVSHFSSFHFHRLFHALVGETVNEYISRKRMEKAAKMLIYKPGMTVTDIAEAGGFSSCANFAKAFKLYFGVSASELRKGKQVSDNRNDSKIGKIYSKYGKVFKPQDLYSQFVSLSGIFDPGKLEEMLMKVKVETREEQPIAFLTSPKGYELDSVYATWDKVINWASSKGLDEKHKLNLRFVMIIP